MTGYARQIHPWFSWHRNFLFLYKYRFPAIYDIFIFFEGLSFTSEPFNFLSASLRARRLLFFTTRSWMCLYSFLGLVNSFRCFSSCSSSAGISSVFEHSLLSGYSARRISSFVLSSTDFPIDSHASNPADVSDRRFSDTAKRLDE
jgi:hypothetical protein